MDEKMIKKGLRREYGKSGAALLIYYALMNVAVLLVCVLDTLTKAVIMGNGTEDEIYNALYDSLSGNAWGYIVAILIGWLLMLVWKKPNFCFHEIWKTERAMPASTFWMILVLFLGVQGLLQVEVTLLESILNIFGLSAVSAIESASGGADTFSMFLYTCLGAPIAEEILFRGLLLRTMKPYGKGFAIFTTAFLFGIFHGNLVQSPFAFLVGLILGYTAVEYSIGWSMVLHMVNNLVLGDTFSRVTSFLPQMMGDLLLTLVIWGCTIAGIVIMCVRREKITSYIRTNRMHPWCVKSFFASPGVIILTILMVLNMLMGITSL